MIKLLPKHELSGAERFGECINCGVSNNSIIKVEFHNEYNTGRHSIRLCKNCARILATTLLEGSR